MQFVNMTPHEVVLIQNGETVRFAPSGNVARVTEESIPTPLDGVPFIVVRKVYHGVEVLTREDFLSKNQDAHPEPMPEPQEGIIYIVPMLVGQVLAGSRDDLLGPDFGIGGAARDKSGTITGAAGFIKY